MSKAFDKFVHTIAQLRHPTDGCPWDLEQTHQTLKQGLIEEAYEVYEAIDQGPAALREELGDLLLQIIMHAQIASENEDFNINQVIEEIDEKIVRRHPHVFGDKKIESRAELSKTWHDIKRKEKQERAGALSGLPKHYPALALAQKIGRKVSRCNADSGSLKDCQDQLLSDMQRLLECHENSERAEEHFGDLLFSVCQLGRKLGHETEDCLRKACTNFVERFQELESEVGEDGFANLSAEKRQSLWKKTK